MEIVTPGEMAKSLGVSPKTLRAWLRGRRDAGHPLLSTHEHYGRWEFTRAAADSLIVEYRTGRRAAAATAPTAPGAAHGPRDTLAPTPVTRTEVPAGDAPPLPTEFTRGGLTAVG